MNITPEHIFKIKKRLHEEIEEYEKKLQILIKKQAQLTSIEELGQSVLEYDELEHQIEDRTKIFSFFSAPETSVSNPYVKAELSATIEAAETIDLEIVNVLADEILVAVRKEVDVTDDDCAVITNDFKEYVLPAKIIAGKFDELSSLLVEMISTCRQQVKNFNEKEVEKVFVYAWQRAIDADINLDPIIRALRMQKFQFLTNTDRAALLDRVEERLAVLRFEQAKKQQLALQKAVEISKRREKEK